jgi:hypothetical protein
MSYTLEIWQPGPGESPPADLAGALAMVQRLRGERPGPNPLFRQLVETLTRRFPDITSDEAAELPESELAWSDGPLCGDDDRAVFVLGLLTQRLDDVRPFVVDEANALGLAVFDGQAAQAFFPGGIRLFAWPTESADECVDEEDDEDDVPSCRELGAAAFERLGRAVEPLGFKPRKSSLTYKRTLRDGWQSLKVLVFDQGDACELSVLGDIRIDAASDLCNRLVRPHLLPKDAAAFSTAMLRQREWLLTKAPFIEPEKHLYRVTRRAEQDEILSHFEDQVASTLVPILEQAVTIEGVDRVMNTSPLSASPAFQQYNDTFENILVAYLARNPRLPQLCEEVITRTTDRQRKQKAQICADYVFTHPLPQESAR